MSKSNTAILEPKAPAANGHQPDPKPAAVNVETLAPLNAELERAFSFAWSKFPTILNKNGKTITPTILIRPFDASGKKSRCLGVIDLTGTQGAGRRPYTKGGKTSDIIEIGYNLEKLADPTMTPERFIVETIYHEVVHVYAHYKDISVCSMSKRHNKEFREQLLTLGVTAQQDGDNYGYGYISAEDIKTAAAIKKVKEIFKPDPAAFLLARVGFNLEPKEPTAKIERWGCECTDPIVSAVFSVSLIEQIKDTIKCTVCGAFFENLKDKAAAVAAEAAAIAAESTDPYYEPDPADLEEIESEL